MTITGFTTPTVRGEVKGMVVVKGPPLNKPRKLYCFTGFGTNVQYGVHDHSLGNVRRGLVERVYKVEVAGKLLDTPQPIPGEFKQLSRFHDALKPYLTKITRLTPKEFLGFYTGHKLERYQRAVESLEIEPVRVKDSWLTTFVKAEKLNISAKPDPAPRVIQPRDPRYNVEVGRYLRHGEEVLFKGIDRLFGGRTIFKGINADVAGEEMRKLWESFSDPIGIGMDASRFDQHISVDALEFEHEMWCGMYNPSEQKELRRLLGWQITNRGIARCPDGQIKYKVNGCRMSGDMNTSSGNCYIMCATVWNWCKTQGVRKFRLANNGDDCMLVIERRDEKVVRNGLQEYYTRLGFTMKVEPTVDVLEKIEFCQTRPVKIQGTYRMIRNVHHSLSKDLHSLCDIQSDKARNAWVTAVGEGGRNVNDGVPVMCRFFECFPNFNTTAGSQSDMRRKLEDDWKYKFHRSKQYVKTNVDAEARYSFWLAFGLLPDEQIALENSFVKLDVERIEARPDSEWSLLNFARA